MAVHLEKLYLNNRHEPLLIWIGSLSMATTLVTFFLGDKLFQHARWQFLCQVELALWALAPPFWFFYEYFYHFPNHGNPAAGFEKLKAAQDVSAKAWAAISLVLAAIYTARFPG